MKKVLIFILIMLILPTLSADVISLNSGGNKTIIINPDKYIEGFFGCIPTTCTELGYECGSWSDGCGKTLNCGTCASGYTCTSGTCVAEGVTPPSGGPGGRVEVNIAVTPTSINLNLAINTNKEQVITVKNLKSSPATVSIYQTGLTNMVILGNTSLTLAGSETKEFSVIFVAPGEPGIYTGHIIIDGVTIPVSLNVKTKLLLFDSNIVVLNRDYKVTQGSDLRTRVTLLPMGDPERLDVTLNYVIKDYNGKVYLTQSETVLVENKINFNRNFDTGSLPLGKYIVGLELIYPGGVAPSSAHFEIVQKSATDLLVMIVFGLLILIILIAILILFLIIRRRRKQERAGVQ